MSEFTEITDNLTYESPIIDTPFRKKIKLVFADNTATGRPCPYIDDKIKKILPYYTNTHSNSYCAEKMNNLIDATRAYIRKQYKLTEKQKILFTGTGATGAINHLASSINTDNYKTINIFISVLEHHSNYLPWYELAKQSKNIRLFVIPLKDNDIDHQWLENALNKIIKIDVLNIVTITGCSNVTGIMTDIPLFTNIINKYNTNIGKKTTYLFIDCACLSPYKILNGTLADAFFISGHKFIGGATTPGILIATEELFSKQHPYQPGGGCIVSADDKHIVYDSNIEIKESAGTPNIIGIIRLLYVLQLQNEFIDIIETNDRALTDYVHKSLDKLHKSNSNFSFIFPNQYIERRLPIVAIHMSNIHFNLTVALLNDLFGIQTRGGISCCGIFGKYLNKHFNIGGWCRVTFSWIMSKKEIDYIIDSIKFIATYGELFEKYYSYDKSLNSWTFSGKQISPEIQQLIHTDTSQQKSLELIQELK